VSLVANVTVEYYTSNLPTYLVELCSVCPHAALCFSCPVFLPLLPAIIVRVIYFIATYFLFF